MLTFVFRRMWKKREKNLKKAVENKKGDAFLDAELERRYMITHTNPTVKQTEQVLKYKLQQISQPAQNLETMSKEEIQELREHFKSCIISILS